MVHVEEDKARLPSGLRRRVRATRRRMLCTRGDERGHGRASRSAWRSSTRGRGGRPGQATAGSRQWGWLRRPLAYRRSTMRGARLFETSAAQ